jgi:hypothetical protein
LVAVPAQVRMPEMARLILVVGVRVNPVTDLLLVIMSLDLLHVIDFDLHTDQGIWISFPISDHFGHGPPFQRVEH